MSYEDVTRRLPAHAASLHITHNQHKAYYQSIEDYIATYGDSGIPDGDWVSPDEKAKAIIDDSIWEIQWYPSTPIGFNIRFASTLDALLDSFQLQAK